MPGWDRDKQDATTIQVAENDTEDTFLQQVQAAYDLHAVQPVSAAELTNISPYQGESTRSTADTQPIQRPVVPQRETPLTTPAKPVKQERIAPAPRPLAVPQAKKRQLAAGDEVLLEATIGEKIGHTVLDMLILGIGGWLWFQGAKFTLLAFNLPATFWSEKTIINPAWGIPLFFSLVEMIAIPRLNAKAAEYTWWVQQKIRFHKIRRQPKLLWLLLMIVLPIDVGSSSLGFTKQVAGKPFLGWNIPQQGIELVIMGIVVGIVLAYGPERLWSYAKADLETVWGWTKMSRRERATA